MCRCISLTFSLSYKDINTTEATWENFNRDSRVNIDAKSIGPKGLRPADGSNIPHRIRLSTSRVDEISLIDIARGV